MKNVSNSHIYVLECNQFFYCLSKSNFETFFSIKCKYYSNVLSYLFIHVAGKSNDISYSVRISNENSFSVKNTLFKYKNVL